jgi:hypothetical protein
MGDYLTDGQRAEGTIADHRRALLALYLDNEERPLPDTALRSVLLNADRFAAELGSADKVLDDKLAQAEMFCARALAGDHDRKSMTIALTLTVKERAIHVLAPLCTPMLPRRRSWAKTPHSLRTFTCWLTNSRSIGRNTARATPTRRPTARICRSSSK